jgi:hypothetical protein
MASLLILGLFLRGVAFGLSPSAPISNYPSEAEALQHCPADTVV